MDDKETLRYYDRGDKRPDIRAGLEALKDRVLTRSHTLDAEQKALLTVILEQGSSYEQVARLRGEHATTVSRRFRRLLRTLSHGTSGTVVRLNPTDETILSDYYLFGMNQSQIAGRLGISRYRVRKTLARFEPQRGSAPVLRSVSEGGSSPIASDTVKRENNPPSQMLRRTRRSMPCTR
jgi:DNA-directed RNA polymerase specialized sigma24 family protein